MSTLARATVECVARVFDAIDYDRLGPLYCDEGGSLFWADRREPALELGLVWASALRSRLPAGGESLYMGAGVAELPALICEVLELGRRVVVTNLLAAECDELNRALAAAGLAAIRFEQVPVIERLQARSFDHFTMVSVFTDPEFFPAVSGATYGRVPPVLMDLAALAAEREQIRSLMAQIFDAMTPAFLVTTSAEEVAWFLWEAERRGLMVDADEEYIETAVIGDPIGFVRIGARVQPTA